MGNLPCITKKKTGEGEGGKMSGGNLGFPNGSIGLKEGCC